MGAGVEETAAADIACSVAKLEYRYPAPDVRYDLLNL